MNWWSLSILIFLVFDQVFFDHSRRISSGVHIKDWTLANDPEFVEDVAQAVKRSYVREMQKEQQERIK